MKSNISTRTNLHLQNLIYLWMYYSLFYAKKNLEQANTYFVYLNIGYFSTKLFWYPEWKMQLAYVDFLIYTELCCFFAIKEWKYSSYILVFKSKTVYNWNLSLFGYQYRNWNNQQVHYIKIKIFCDLSSFPGLL